MRHAVRRLIVICNAVSQACLRYVGNQKTGIPGEGTAEQTELYGSLLNERPVMAGGWE